MIKLTCAKQVIYKIISLVRASVASGLFAKFTTDVTAIPTKIVDMIDCPGDPTQSEICAVTESSLF